jgi:hypothetical protein
MGSLPPDSDNATLVLIVLVILIVFVVFVVGSAAAISVRNTPKRRWVGRHVVGW